MLVEITRAVHMYMHTHTHALFTHEMCVLYRGYNENVISYIYNKHAYTSKRETHTQGTDMFTFLRQTDRQTDKMCGRCTHTDRPKSDSCIITLICEPAAFTESQRDKPMYRQTDKPTDRQTDKPTDRQTDKLMGRQTD